MSDIWNPGAEIPTLTFIAITLLGLLIIAFGQASKPHNLKLRRYTSDIYFRYIPKRCWIKYPISLGLLNVILAAIGMVLIFVDRDNVYRKELVASGITILTLDIIVLLELEEVLFLIRGKKPNYTANAKYFLFNVFVVFIICVVLIGTALYYSRH